MEVIVLLLTEDVKRKPSKAMKSEARMMRISEASYCFCVLSWSEAF